MTVDLPLGGTGAPPVLPPAPSIALTTSSGAPASLSDLTEQSLTTGWSGGGPVRTAVETGVRLDFVPLVLGGNISSEFRVNESTLTELVEKRVWTPHGFRTIKQTTIHTLQVDTAFEVLPNEVIVLAQIGGLTVFEASPRLVDTLLVELTVLERN